MLKQRLITALLLIPAVLVSTWFLPGQYFAAVLGLFVVVAAWEWAAISGVTRSNHRAVFTLIIIISITVCYLLKNPLVTGVITGLALCWWLFAAGLVIYYQRQENLRKIKPVTGCVIGILVLLPTWTSLVWLHANGRQGVAYVIFLFVLVWLADAAAYFSGRQWGRSRLAERISPGKSWAGVFGGLLTCAVFASLYAFATRLQVPDIIMFSLISLATVMISIVGDLTESLFKRMTDIKDSGSIFPGHGGVMDRMDSLTAAAPFFSAGLWLSGLI